MKNMVKIKPAKMTGGAGGGIGRIEKSSVAPGKDVPNGVRNGGRK